MIISKIDSNSCGIKKGSREKNKEFQNKNIENKEIKSPII